MRLQPKDEYYIVSICKPPFPPLRAWKYHRDPKWKSQYVLASGYPDIVADTWNELYLKGIVSYGLTEMDFITPRSEREQSNTPSYYWEDEVLKGMTYAKEIILNGE